VKFGSGKKITVGTAIKIAPIVGNLLTVTIDNTIVTYTQGAAATSADGTMLHALVLVEGNTHKGVFYSECGPFLMEMEDPDPERKRAPETRILSGTTGRFIPSVTALGDPHLTGDGIKFDVYGKPAANYSLLVAPSFEVNMQLANRGPELRFMMAMSVLYKGKSFVIKPWTLQEQARRAGRAL
jgi:hypothetical protein